MEICSQMKFQESKPRPTFLTKGITKPWIHIWSYSSHCRACSSKGFTNTGTRITPIRSAHHIRMQSGTALRGQREPCIAPLPFPHTSKALLLLLMHRCPHRGSLSGWWLHVHCFQQGCVSAALLVACGASARLFILHSFSPQTDVSSPQGLWGVARKRMAMSIWYTSLWELYRVLQFPVWQSSQK